jgi:glucose/arabinose dehydrogenase
MNKLFTSCLVTLFYSAYCQPQVGLLPFASGLNGAISDIAHTNDGRLFVTEQLGYIRIVQPNGSVSARPFLDIHSKVTPNEIDSVKEQGLLGLAFSPNYATDGYFYVHYTNKTGVGNVVIARYHVSSNADSADANSEQILLTVNKPYTNHNGGCIKFGPDGFLYVGIGDGGGGGDPGNRAQKLDSLQGKILRLDVSGGGAYDIPPTNPFINNATARPEIWAYGLRNPWRFSFDRVTHHLWIADVGEQTWEEINFQNTNSTGGENYGWKCYEGNHPYSPSNCGSAPSFISPRYEYSHTSVGGCSVTGGYVYRGTAEPNLYGYYFYADFCNSTIYTLTTNGNFTNGVAGTFTDKHFTTFGENNAGELFVGDHTTGTIYRITGNPNGIINSWPIANYLSIYPSPTNGRLNCEFNLTEEANLEFNITDVTGKVFYSTKALFSAGKNSTTFNTESLAAGFYILQINNKGNTLARKFIVE